MNFVQLGIIILISISVGIADALIKKVAVSGDVWQALKNPLTILILILYVSQMFFLFYIFRHQWKLSIVGNLQMIFVSLTVVLAGMLIFGEKISILQGVGIVLGLIGIILMNI